MRVQHKCFVQIGLDATFNDKVFYPEDATQQTVFDNMRNAQSGTLNIAPSAVVALSPGEVADVRGVYVRVNGVCQIRINSGPWETLQPATSVANTSARYFKEGPLTLVELQASSVALTPITGVYAVWGDPISGS